MPHLELGKAPDNMDSGSGAALTAPSGLQCHVLRATVSKCPEQGSRYLTDRGHPQTKLRVSRCSEVRAEYQFGRERTSELMEAAQATFKGEIDGPLALTQNLGHTQARLAYTPTLQPYCQWHRKKKKSPGCSLSLISVCWGRSCGHC